ncbi:hypothetical protein LEP1GSC158_4246 [Leptospira interrogans serovar Zanoni str. LT2156]|uniref:Uncharacterized protein n=1 Tax=Leptospira interrogans serovar Zanoni str. LT2156 TaxID=1001601 RepID=M6HDW2_LEPIR|nr:hypothetical protein LEP1GSC158_4246 [Leptospira interrogans serovar Zanoni str. LT2156]
MVLCNKIAEGIDTRNIGESHHQPHKYLDLNRIFEKFHSGD